jgi:tRNA U38,U39,U40 pseudouridine synthase TruA
VVQFYSDNPALDATALPFKLNRLLPPDIRVTFLRFVNALHLPLISSFHSFSSQTFSHCVSRKTAPDFSVTISARTKTYHFLIDNNEEHDPITHRFRMHVPKSLDLDAMKVAMNHIRVRGNL